MRSLRPLLPVLAGTIAALLTVVGSTGGGQTTAEPAKVEPPPRTRLMQEVTFYPRLIRLAHSGPANGRTLLSVVTDTPSHTGVIFESTNDGASFAEVGRIADPWGASPRGGCCASIFELPRQIGDLPAGTLLWASSMGRGAEQARLRLWKSADIGRTWSYVSSPFAAPNGLGVWEPELSIDHQGRLVVHFADETEQPAHSQILARVVSTDAMTWSGKERTVVGAAWERPGMPVVAELPDGSYVMTYEICGLAAPYHCDVRLRYSTDGWTWGDPADLGARPTTVDGRYFTHTPTITTGPDGKLFLIGQILQERDGRVAPTNGASVFVNTENGRGPWVEIPAPVHVPGAKDAVCPNYSPTLLPSTDGQQLLEVTTDTPPDGFCAAYFGTGSAVGGTGQAKRPDGWQQLINGRSAHCLDVVQASTAAGAPIGQWICIGFQQQHYRAVPVSRTTVRLEIRHSGQCVSAAGPGAPVTQQPCSDAARSTQEWTLRDAGRSTFRLVHTATGQCAGQVNDDGAPGGRVTLSGCTDQQRQMWRFLAAG